MQCGAILHFINGTEMESNCVEIIVRRRQTSRHIFFIFSTENIQMHEYFQKNLWKTANNYISRDKMSFSSEKNRCNVTHMINCTTSPVNLYLIGTEHSKINEYLIS